MPEANDLRALAGRGLAALTPHPHRGDLIAAGAVPLTLSVLLVNARLNGVWATGILLVVTALACGLVLGMGLLAPLEAERARSYQQVLLLAGVALGFMTLVRLAEVLGADDPLSSSGSLTWILLVVTVGAAWIARTRRSAICVLIAALAGIATVLAFVDWTFAPEGPTTLRWLLVALAVVLVLAALARRDVERRESVYLIDAAGAAIVLLGLSFVGALIGVLTFVGAPPGLPGTGWKLVLLGAGLGLVAYASVDREPGPGYLGTLILLLFVALVGVGASLWFWPLALLLVGGGAIAAGLRPRQELPPEPPARPGAGGRPDADPPTAPLRGPGAGAGGSLWASPPPADDDDPT